MYELTKLNETISSLSLTEADQAALLLAVRAVEGRVAADAEARNKDSSLEYWQTVEAIAKEAFEEHKDDESAADEFVHESVDGNYWVIYTHANYKVMQYTDNDDAYAEYGDLHKGGFGAMLTSVAFCAMKADVMNKYRELVDDYEPEDDEELEASEEG
jgi:hypothetical protein